MADLRALIDNRDFEALRQALIINPALANEGIPLCEGDGRKAHPLHRVCDAVFAKKITEEDAIEIANILLAYGADINGDKLKDGRDAPLIAAASLHAERVAIFYIQRGANVHLTGREGETALHWAGYCGRDKLTERLVQAGADINLRDISYKGTPLGWTLNTLMENDAFNTCHQAECIKLLLKAGADVNLLGKDAFDYLYTLADSDAELNALLQ